MMRSSVVVQCSVLELRCLEETTLTPQMQSSYKRRALIFKETFFIALPIITDTFHKFGKQAYLIDCLLLQDNNVTRRTLPYGTPVSGEGNRPARNGHSVKQSWNERLRVPPGGGGLPAILTHTPLVKSRVT